MWVKGVSAIKVFCFLWGLFPPPYAPCHHFTDLKYEEWGSFFAKRSPSLNLGGRLARVNKDKSLQLREAELVVGRQGPRN